MLVGDSHRTTLTSIHDDLTLLYMVLAFNTFCVVQPASTNFLERKSLSQRQQYLPIPLTFLVTRLNIFNDSLKFCIEASVEKV